MSRADYRRSSQAPNSSRSAIDVVFTLSGDVSGAPPHIYSMKAFVHLFLMHVVVNVSLNPKF
jgi:hypothetical protein